MNIPKVIEISRPSSIITNFKTTFKSFVSLINQNNVLITQTIIGVTVPTGEKENINERESLKRKRILNTGQPCVQIQVQVDNGIEDLPMAPAKRKYTKRTNCSHCNLPGHS